MTEIEDWGVGRQGALRCTGACRSRETKNCLLRCKHCPKSTQVSFQDQSLWEVIFYSDRTSAVCCSALFFNEQTRTQTDKSRQTDSPGVTGAIQSQWKSCDNALPSLLHIQCLWWLHLASDFLKVFKEGMLHIKNFVWPPKRQHKWRRREHRT